MTDADWIALDWGTTNLRAWAMAHDGSVLESAHSGSGMDRLAGGAHQYESALLDLVEPWLSANRVTVVLACGMAGVAAGLDRGPLSTGAHTGASRECADARSMRGPAPSGTHRCGRSAGIPPDVMRGEETAIAGLLRLVPEFDGTVILPGTHTKWVHVAGGQIVRFTTFLTGELFGLLTGASILRHSVCCDGFDPDAFAAEFSGITDKPEAMAARLFALRAEHLLQGADPVVAASRLSGCLVGLEFAGALAYRDAKQTAVIAKGILADQYRIALDQTGSAFCIVDPDECVLAGLRDAFESLTRTEGSAKFGT